MGCYSYALFDSNDDFNAHLSYFIAWLINKIIVNNSIGHHLREKLLQDQ